MKEQLSIILLNELEAIEQLLKALEKQHTCLISSNAVTLESCVKDIDEINKRMAEWEVKRREITHGRSMREIIDEIRDEEIEKNFRKIRRLLEEAKLQKDTNELLIKQGLGFTNKILNIMNPSRTPKIYNSYGKIKK